MTDLISINAAARIARACCGVGKPELIEQYLLAGTPAYIVEAEMVSAEAAPAPAPAAAAPDATMTDAPAGCRTSGSPLKPGRRLPQPRNRRRPRRFRVLPIQREF